MDSHDLRYKTHHFFKYLRFNIFEFLLIPFQKQMRKSRMTLFLEKIQPVKNMKILDLGGTPEIWDFVDLPLNITCLNLSINTKMRNYKTHHNIVFIEGDACNLSQFEYGDFDLVFSNSVIEHVGGNEKQTKFCDEVKRISDKHWIQTPHKNFPIEAHCGMFFWWYYPDWIKQYFINGWSKKLPAWTDMIVNTTFIDKDNLRKMLPKSRIFIEHYLIFPKSIIAYSTNNS